MEKKRKSGKHRGPGTTEPLPVGQHPRDKRMVSIQPIHKKPRPVKGGQSSAT